MAEFTINVVAEDINCIPTAAQIAQGKDLLRSFFPRAQYEVEAKVADKPFFVTARDGFYSIKCPECGETIERFGDNDDHDEWWNDCFLDLTHYSAAPDLDEEVTMPCCGATPKLGDIDLESDAHLTKFAMSLRDPDDATSLTSIQMEGLKAVLGCSIRQITSVRS